VEEATRRDQMYAEYATKGGGWETEKEGLDARVGWVREVVLQRCDTESITLEGDDGEMGGRRGDGDRKETCL
jgi:hypothetical protein